MRYSAEPVPATIDPVTAEYLDRQFNAIGLAFTPEGRLVLPTTSVLPKRSIPGAILYLKDQGVFACVSTTKDGVASWVNLSDTLEPIDRPEVDLSGKTWDDFI